MALIYLQTVRLPRLIGIQNALQIILPGGSVRPSKAKALGLVDEVVPSDDRFLDEFRYNEIHLIHRCPK